MNRWGALALLLAVAGALALRCPGLDIRPLHNDEAVNAVKLSDLWKKGVYTYDLDEFHGPALYYSTLPFLWLSRDRDADQLNAVTMRLVTVAFGAGMILLLVLLADGLGRMATVWAGIFTAVSPAMVFYSRYFIHEMLLVFFTLLALAAGWRYKQTRKLPWAVLAGVGLGLMYATKETFVFAVAAMGLAVVASVWWNQWRAQRSALVAGRTVGPCISPFSLRPFAAVCDWKHAVIALIVAVLVSHLLFSSFFMNLIGPIDSLRTYLPWLRRAGGHSPHIHPWYFYLERLAWFHPAKGPIWSEALILILAVVGAVVAFFSNKVIVDRPGFARFLAFYTVILAAMYSVISYKTPWCALGFLSGMILLAGIGAAALFRLSRKVVTKTLVVTVLIAGTSHLAWGAWRASQTYASNRNNPYVYAQTSPDLLRLVERVEAIARIAPLGHETVIKVIAPESYWPLPWYLRKFKQIGWWEELPPDPYAPITIVSATLRARLDEKSNKACLMTGLFELRPGVFLELYVETELWKKFVETLPREVD